MSEQQTQEKEPELFEIPEQPKAKEISVMTEAKANEMGWSQEEISIAKEQGMLGEEKPKENEPPKDPEPPKEEPEKPKEEPKPVSEHDDFLLNPDEEKILAEKLDQDPSLTKKLKNVSAQYWGRKHAISRAQAAESERDRIMDENRELKERMGKLESRIDEIPSNKNGVEEEDDRPLTKKELREMLIQTREDDERKKRDQEEKLRASQEKINKALQYQESHAKLNYQDYDKVVALGNKLVGRDGKTGQFSNPVNITTIPETARKRAFVLLRQIQNAAARADELKTSDYNAADMAYDLGKLASEFIREEDKPKDASPASPSAERTAGGLTPEDEERIRRNKSRAGSSAQVTGSGGRRVITADEVTVDDLVAMDGPTFDSFQKKHPEKVEELMRG